MTISRNIYFTIKMLIQQTYLAIEIFECNTPYLIYPMMSPVARTSCHMSSLRNSHVPYVTSSKIGTSNNAKMPMSHVDFKKSPCRRVGFSGLDL